MTDIFEKIENIFNESMKQVKELTEKERFAEASKTKQRKPEPVENYYAVVWDASVLEPGLKIGKCFKTDEEAQKELDCRLSEQELLDMCDFDGRVELCYDEHSECFEADDSSELPYYHSPYRFSSKESCEKAIEQLGTEKLKLIFRID